MAAMRASGQRLCQMVHDAGLRRGVKDRLQTVLETGWWMAAVDANYDSQLDQMIDATTNKFMSSRSSRTTSPYSSIPHARAPQCLPP